MFRGHAYAGGHGGPPLRGGFGFCENTSIDLDQRISA